MVKTIVVDASLSLSWILSEAVDPDKVNRIVDDQVRGELITTAPDIWFYECLNGLKSAFLRERIDEKTSRNYISKVIDLAPDLTDVTELVNEVFEIAIRYDLSVYDASYVALAAEKHCDFYTGDIKLYAKMGKKLKFVKLISDYR